MSTTTEVINLNSSLDITQVHHYYKVFLQAIAGKQGITLDASAVEQVDCAFLQLLLVTFNKAKTDGLDIAWTGATDKLVSVAKMMGMSKHLDLD
jgi:anti-anti-sigma regulatory factor